MSNSCEYCGSEISPNKKYCDRQCYGKDISKGVQETCDYCGDNFSRNPSNEQRFCSRECFGKATQTRKEIECTQCNKTVEKEPNELDNNQNKFCSRSCKREYERLDETNCKYCDTKFQPTTSSRKYCSRQCCANDRQNKVTVNCSECGNSLEKKRSYVNKYDNIFCSDDCLSDWKSRNSLFATNNPNKKDGRYGGYGSNWPEWNEKIRNRANGTCENCNKSKEENGRALSVHHIEPRKEFINDKDRIVEDSNNSNNLIALCQSCHMKVEHGKIAVENNV